MGRFLQTYPIGYEDQMNLYAYVHNDPLNFTDPNGKFSQNNKELLLDAVIDSLKKKRIDPTRDAIQQTLITEYDLAPQAACHIASCLQSGTFKSICMLEKCHDELMGNAARATRATEGKPLNGARLDQGSLKYKVQPLDEEMHAFEEEEQQSSSRFIVRDCSFSRC